jgi:hypothetical protein
MDSVHRMVNRTCASSWWIADRGGGGGSSELGITAIPKHGSSSTGAQQREGDTGIPARASSRCGRQCGGWATAVKKWRRRCSVRTMLRCGEKRRRVGRGTVEGGGALPLYRGRGGGDGRGLRGRNSDMNGDKNGSLITSDLLRGLKEGKGGN